MSRTISFARIARRASIVAVAAALVGSSAVSAQAVVLPAGSPRGNFDTVTAVSGGVRVTGWAWDANTTAALNVSIQSSASTTAVANGYRPDVARAFPAAGAYRGFAKVLPLGGGTHTVCVTAKNVGTGVDAPFGCKTVTVAGTPTASTTTANGTWAATSYDLTAMGWRGKEEAAPGRVSVVSGTAIPGSGAARPTTLALRTELKNGDRTKTGSYIAPRTEVFGRQPTKLTDSYTTWPDPHGAERWYKFRVYTPANFPTTTDTKWLTFTQWKGLNGGSPPVALEIKKDFIRLGGTRTNAGAFPSEGSIGKLVKGQWTEILVGMKLSTDKSQGWVEVYRDGVRKIARTPVATMDVIGGKPDPIYLKQGVYRSTAWTVDHVMYFGPTEVRSAKF